MPSWRNFNCRATAGVAGLLLLAIAAADFFASGDRRRERRRDTAIANDV
jgi:hypothetical protein